MYVHQFLTCLQEPDNRWLSVTQVHGTKVCLLVTDKDRANHRATTQADAIVTNLPATSIAIKTADCCPVLLGNAEVVAAVHAGWRGAAAGIIENTVSVVKSLSSKPLTAHLGPTISQAVYQVDRRFIDTLLVLTDQSPLADSADKCWRFLKQGYPPDPDRYHFDLSGYVAYRLLRSHIRCLDMANQCTYRLADRFASYRRASQHNGDINQRQWSLIQLAG